MEKEIFGNPLVKEINGEIKLDKVSLNSLKNTISTPFYLILAEKIRENIRTLQTITQKVFGIGKIQISYSVKANYMDCVLREVNKQNLPFEIISQFEYDLLKKYGLNTDNLIVGGPYLPNSLIESIIEEKNPLFILYNADQIQRVNRIAQDRKLEVNALLRFTAPKITGHLGFLPNSSTFTLLKAIIPNCDNIRFMGTHSHYGTQINSQDTYKKNIKYIIEITRKLENLNLITPEIFDIGGGLPNAGSIKENQLITLFTLIKNEFEKNGFPAPRICMEPGRYIVEDAGLFLMKIIDVNKEKSTCFVNAGTYVLPRFARNSLRFYNIDQSLSHYNKKITIYGIVPSEEDILIKNYNFSPTNEIGNKILVMNCGAYAFTFSTRFPYKIPPVVFIDGTSYKIYSLIH
jgi:diaminopimelate decarboxylase